MIDSAKQAASQAKDTASKMLDQVKGQATSHVDQQRQTLASGMQAVADAFQSMGEGLRQKAQGPVADYAAEIGHAMGGQVEQLASHLRDRDLRQLITETEEFARRSPAVFLGGAFVIGLAASRFLKSSGAASKSPTNPRQAAPPLGTPLALPPASTPIATSDPSLPSGFPFTSRDESRSSSPAGFPSTVPAPLGGGTAGA